MLGSSIIICPFLKFVLEKGLSRMCTDNLIRRSAQQIPGAPGPDAEHSPSAEQSTVHGGRESRTQCGFAFAELHPLYDFHILKKKSLFDG